jgi:hypothetical protein
MGAPGGSLTAENVRGADAAKCGGGASDLNRWGSTMTDLNDLLTQLSAFAERLAESVAKLLAVATHCLKGESQQGSWHHERKEVDPILFFLIKLAGAASVANAMIVVAKRCFWFEAAVLARTVYDSNLSIAFMLPSTDMGADGWPSEKQKQHLR